MERITNYSFELKVSLNDLKDKYMNKIVDFSCVSPISQAISVSLYVYELSGLYKLIRLP